MTLLEKIDTVLQYLYEHSGENPNFPMLNAALNIKGVEEGEIRDILIKLRKEGLIYCEAGGLMDVNYSDYGHYLISFDGKYFWETERGFIPKFTKSDVENTRKDAAITYQSEQADTLNRLTGWIAIASGMAAVYYLLQILEWVYTHWKPLLCNP